MMEMHAWERFDLYLRGFHFYVSSVLLFYIVIYIPTFFPSTFIVRDYDRARECMRLSKLNRKGDSVLQTIPSP